MTRRRVATAIADAVRRALDIVVAVVVLVVGSPVLVAVALCIRATMGSPVLFRQPRLEIGRAHV